MFDSKQPRSAAETQAECDARAKRVDAMFDGLLSEVNSALRTIRTHNYPLAGGRRLSDPR